MERWHEPTLVGVAVSLFGLANLLPAPVEIFPIAAGDVVPAVAMTPTTSPNLFDIPTDDSYYRDKWAAESAAFYIANPPREMDAPPATRSTVIPASVRTPVLESTQRESTERDAAVSNSSAEAKRQPNSMVAVVPSQAAALMPAKQRWWRVVTCVAAGLLSAIVFASVWPAFGNGLSEAVDRAQSKLEVAGGGDVIPIKIPADWVAVRPTGHQLARQAVLSASYVFAAVGAWGILA